MDTIADDSLPPPLRGSRPCIGAMLFTDLLSRVASSLFGSDRHKLRELCVASRDSFDRDVAMSLRLADSADRSVAAVAHTARAIVARGCCPRRVQVDLRHGSLEERQQGLLEFLRALASCTRPGASCTESLAISGALLSGADVAASAAAACPGATRLELRDLDSGTCRRLGAALLPLLHDDSGSGSTTCGVGSAAAASGLGRCGWRRLASLELHVQGPRPLAAPLCEALAAAGQLRRLSLTTQDLPLTRSDARQLGRLTQLHSLALDDVMQADVLRLALAPLTRLTSLVLGDGTDVGESGPLPAAVFSSLVQLRQLRMPDHALQLPRPGECSLLALAALTSLRVGSLVRARDDNGAAGLGDVEDEDDDSDWEEDGEEEEDGGGGGGRRLRAVPLVLWPQQLRELELHDSVVSADVLACLTCAPVCLEHVVVHSTWSTAPDLDLQVHEGRFARRDGSLLPAGAWALALALAVLGRKLRWRYEGPWGAAGPVVPVGGLVLDVVPRPRRHEAPEQEEEGEVEEQEEEQEEQEQEEAQPQGQGPVQPQQQQQQQQEAAPGQQQGQVQQPQPLMPPQLDIGEGGEGAALPPALWPRALLPVHDAGADVDADPEAVTAAALQAIEQGQPPPPPAHAGHAWLLMLAQAQLKRLMLDGLSLGDCDFGVLARAMPTLQHLSLGYACAYDPVSLLALGGMPGLTSVALAIDYWCYGPGSAPDDGTQPAAADGAQVAELRARVVEQLVRGELDRAGEDSPSERDRMLGEACGKAAFWVAVRAQLMAGGGGDLAPPEQCGLGGGRCWTAAQADLILALAVVAAAGRRKQPQLRKIEVCPASLQRRLPSRLGPEGAQDRARRCRGQRVGTALVGVVHRVLARLGITDSSCVRVGAE